GSCGRARGGRGCGSAARSGGPPGRRSTTRCATRGPSPPPPVGPPTGGGRRRSGRVPGLTGAWRPPRRAVGLPGPTGPPSCSGRREPRRRSCGIGHRSQLARLASGGVPVQQRFQGVCSFPVRWPTSEVGSFSLLDGVSDPVLVEPDRPVRDVLALMNARRIGAVVVVDDRRAPVGVFSERDLL